MSVFFWWQIICYLCGGSDRSNSVRTAGMLISLTIAIIIALLFGKVTVKEIKEEIKKGNYKIEFSTDLNVRVRSAIIIKKLICNK